METFVVRRIHHTEQQALETFPDYASAKAFAKQAYADEKARAKALNERFGRYGEMATPPWLIEVVKFTSGDGGGRRVILHGKR